MVHDPICRPSGKYWSWNGGAKTVAYVNPLTNQLTGAGGSGGKGAQGTARRANHHCICTCMGKHAVAKAGVAHRFATCVERRRKCIRDFFFSLVSPRVWLLRVAGEIFENDQSGMTADPVLAKEMFELSSKLVGCSWPESYKRK